MSPNVFLAGTQCLKHPFLQSWSLRPSATSLSAAISTRAGIALIHDADRLPLLTEIMPSLKGMALLFWAIEADPPNHGEKGARPPPAWHPPR